MADACAEQVRVRTAACLTGMGTGGELRLASGPESCAHCSKGKVPSIYKIAILIFLCFLPKSMVLL